MKVPSPMINIGGRHTLRSKDLLPPTHSPNQTTLNLEDTLEEYTISCFDGLHCRWPMPMELDISVK